jgi:malonyl-CoA O-methyltransferase
MGGQCAGSRPLVWDGYETEEVLYGWADTRSLIDREIYIMEAPKNIRTAYDRWSENYDTQENPTRDLDGVVLRRLFPEVAGRTVVECGCGTGKNTIWLAQRCQRLIALDFSEGMLEIARGKIDAAHVRFYPHDIRRPWPVEEETADTVLFNLILEHIDDLRPVFANAVQVMRPGARMLLSEYHPDRLNAGDGARFISDGSEEVEIVSSFTHTLIDYSDATSAAGLLLLSSTEWGDDVLGLESVEEDLQGPRILSMVFEKPTGSPSNELSG